MPNVRTSFAGPAGYYGGMAAPVVMQPSFLHSTAELPRNTLPKVFKALRSLVEDPRSPGLHLEKLTGRSSELWSARVDDNFRIIFFFSDSKTPVVVFVGKHDVAYGFADRHSRVREISMSFNAAPFASPSTLYSSELPDESDDGLEFLKRQPAANAQEEDGEDKMHEDEELPIMDERRILAVVDDVEVLVATRKYLPLAFFLMESKTGRRELDFETVGRLASLPKSAMVHRAWWANESKGRHVQARAWMAVGWRVESVDLKRQTVVFARS